MNWINNKMKLFKKSAVQWLCVPALIKLSRAMMWMERLESLKWSMRVLWREYNLQLERLVCGEQWHAASLQPGDECGVWRDSVEM